MLISADQALTRLDIETRRCGLTTLWTVSFHPFLSRRCGCYHEVESPQRAVYEMQLITWATAVDTRFGESRWQVQP